MDGIDKFEQMIAITQSDLVIGAESVLNGEEVVKSALNRSRLKAEALYNWPALNDAKKTSSVADQDYYDVPETWRPDSMWRLSVNGVRYGEGDDGSPLIFPDYLNFKEDYPSSTEKKWSINWLRYFISPTPTADGNNNIVTWGQKNGDWLSENEDTTIFSYSMPECNEAIILEAKAMLKQKGKEISQDNQFLSLEAKAILTTAWNRIKAQRIKNEVARPAFNVPQFFGRKRSNPTGDFDL